MEDYWEADESAIGLRGANGNLAYVTCFWRKSGRYGLIIEAYSNCDLPGEELLPETEMALDDLVGILESYLE